MAGADVEAILSTATDQTCHQVTRRKEPHSALPRYQHKTPDDLGARRTFVPVCSVTNSKQGDSDSTACTAFTSILVLILFMSSWLSMADVQNAASLPSQLGAQLLSSALVAPFLPAKYIWVVLFTSWDIFSRRCLMSSTGNWRSTSEPSKSLSSLVKCESSSDMCRLFTAMTRRNEPFPCFGVRRMAEVMPQPDMPEAPKTRAVPDVDCSDISTRCRTSHTRP